MNALGKFFMLNILLASGSTILAEKALGNLSNRANQSGDKPLLGSRDEAKQTGLTSSQQKTLEAGNKGMLN